jgi:branched-chain amino acid transport system ATP-binding protein
MHTGEPILDVRGISLSFKGVNALSDLSFSVARGAISALIGPNGAGKSSLLNVLNGVYIPDAGEIVFEESTFTRSSRWPPRGAVSPAPSRTTRCSRR